MLKEKGMREEFGQFDHTILKGCDLSQVFGENESHSHPQHK